MNICSVKLLNILIAESIVSIKIILSLGFTEGILKDPSMYPETNECLLTLIQSNIVSSNQLSSVLSAHFKLPTFHELESIHHSIPSSLIPYAFIQKYKIFPFQETENSISIASVYPWQKSTYHWYIQKLEYQKTIHYFYTSQNVFQNYLKKYHFEETLLPQPLTSIHYSIKQEPIDSFNNDSPAIEVASASQKSPLEEYIQFIFQQARAYQASDIHIEPFKNTFQLRYRIDGQLFKQETIINKQFGQELITKLKLAAGLDLTERRRSQDGSLSLINYFQQDDKIRISVIPSIQGESVVLRLQNNLQSRELRELGMGDDQVEFIYEAILEKPGLSLVIGPTGSGKTTTLYALLEKFIEDRKKILTIEDPIEKILPQVSQTQIDLKNHISFESSIKKILRQSPDIIMIGEIRDKYTAQAAISAAFTGHIVLSSIHSANATNALCRYLHFGIEMNQLISSLRLCVSQKLIPRVCIDCKGRGCEGCYYKKLKGRIGVFEILENTPEFQMFLKDRFELNPFHKIHKEYLYSTFEEELKKKINSGEIEGECQQNVSLGVSDNMSFNE